MRLPERGSNIRVTVSWVGNPFVRADFHGQVVFIDRTEFFWVWPESDEADVDHFVKGRFPVGSQQDVFVMRYMYPISEILGSLRRVDGETSPYRILSREPPDRVYEARVTTPFGAFGGRSYLCVSLYGGLLAIVPRVYVDRAPQLRSLTVGDTLPVRIELLDIWEPRLEVRPAAG